MARPSNFPPPFSARDYVAEPTDPPDERIEVGVLVVGDVHEIVPKLTELVKERRGS